MLMPVRPFGEEQKKLSEPVFCTYVIPTIGRESLSRAVESVLQQDFDPLLLEVVVVNDSGKPLPPAVWQARSNVRILNTNKRERSVARNSGAAIARGRYLAFLDDDDWILPGAVQKFWQISQENPQAGWLCGGIRIVDSNDTLLAEINSGLKENCFAQVMGGAWAPLQASILRADLFFELGGFDPMINGTEDDDLCRRYASVCEFANIPVSVACLFRGQTWNTSTNYLRAAEDTRYSRDRLLSQEGVFTRLMASTGSAYWRGRIAKVYASTAAWNFRRRRLFKAVSRAVYCAASIVKSYKQVFSAQYWQGVRADHVPESLHFVIKAMEEKGLR